MLRQLCVRPSTDSLIPAGPATYHASSNTLVSARFIDINEHIRCTYTDGTSLLFYVRDGSYFGGGSENPFYPDANTPRIGRASGASCLDVQDLYATS